MSPAGPSVGAAMVSLMVFNELRTFSCLSLSFTFGFYFENEKYSLVGLREQKNIKLILDLKKVSMFLCWIKVFSGIHSVGVVFV